MLPILIPLAPAVIVSELVQDLKYGFPGLCNREAPRPGQFAIRNAQREYCILRELIDGQPCSMPAKGQNTRPLPTILAYAEQWTREDFSVISGNPEIHFKLSQLEGLQMYLYADRPCRFDSRNDFLDLRAAYSLYQAVQDDPALRDAFDRGKVGCVLAASVGAAIPQTYELSFMRAAVKLNHAPSETRASHCFIIQ